MIAVLSSDNDKYNRFSQLVLSKAIVKRCGLHWEIFIEGSDGITRPTSPINPRFYRWITAARLIGTINAEINTAAWIALD